ncbi:uncharacterized protein [Hoplias malabaricus]|uniref:uncharacterized protein n=1 Tax=Hoplias malabaricus TaxID=27720 RepID=UPI0034622FD2
MTTPALKTQSSPTQFSSKFNRVTRIQSRELDRKFKLIGPRGGEYDSGSAATLSCHLSPEVSAVDLEIRWFKWTECVCLYKNRQVTEGRGYEGRVSLFTQELQRGNVSLQIRNCTPSDRGHYLCQVTDGDKTEECTVAVWASGNASPKPQRCTDPISNKVGTLCNMGNKVTYRKTFIPYNITINRYPRHILFRIHWFPDPALPSPSLYVTVGPSASTKRDGKFVANPPRTGPETQDRGVPHVCALGGEEQWVVMVFLCCSALWILEKCFINILRGSGRSPLNRTAANTTREELRDQSTVPQRGGFRGRGRGRGRGGLNREAFTARHQRGGQPFTLDRGFAATRGTGKLERYQKIRSQTPASFPGTVLTVSLPNAKSPTSTLSGGAGVMLRGRLSAGRLSPKGIQLRFNYKASTNQTGVSLHDRFTSLRVRGRGQRGGRGRGEIRGGGRGRGGLRGGMVTARGGRARARGGRAAAAGARGAGRAGRMVILQ